MEAALILGLVVAVFTLVVGIVVHIFVAKKKRREALSAFAARNGLECSADDPYNLPARYDFGLFDMGDGRGAENVMTGKWKGMTVVQADFWYFTRSTDSGGSTSRSYRYFQVGVIPIGAALPKLSVTAENIFTRIADHLGLQDINFESENFNRIFNVKSKDREFAFKLIDARMIEWLLSKGKVYGVETSGPAILVYTGKRKPQQLEALLDTCRDLLDRVPRLVWEDYKTEPAAGGSS